MPIFDFKCNKCNKIIEKIVTHREADNPIDCGCKKEGKLQRVRKVAKTNIAFNGRWFSNTGGY